MATRVSDAISVLHDRNPLFVHLSDGSLRNAYTVRILNKSLEKRTFAISVSGLTDADIDVIGGTGFANGSPLVDVGPDQSREVRVLVTERERLPAKASVPIKFSISAKNGGAAASAADHFFGP